MVEGKSKKRFAGPVVLAAVFVAIVIAGVIHYRKPISLRGAIVREDGDTRRQSPIEGAQISAIDDVVVPPTKTDFSGFFKLTLPRWVLRGHRITLHVTHPDYEPQDLQDTVSDKLSVVRMIPLQTEVSPPTNRPKIGVANILVRYSIESSTTANIGTGIKTLQVENNGNVPCDHRSPCSPDGKWKAAIGSASLDAGNGNHYENARLSCIAGPCPFTNVSSDGFSRGGRTISVSILNWSDTTTFLLQAEVFRTEIGNIVRESYPVIFGDALNFSLPPTAQGPTLEAEVNGSSIIFPLAPIAKPTLSWADCNVSIGKDQSKMYRCELKPRYQFQ
jgi:hypothetical protein